MTFRKLWIGFGTVVVFSYAAPANQCRRRVRDHDEADFLCANWRTPCVYRT